MLVVALGCNPPPLTAGYKLIVSVLRAASPVHGAVHCTLPCTTTYQFLLPTLAVVQSSKQATTLDS